MNWASDYSKTQPYIYLLIDVVVLAKDQIATDQPRHKRVAIVFLSLKPPQEHHESLVYSDKECKVAGMLVCSLENELELVL